ncbi:MAG TPA: glycosyltransferase family 39 protein [Polyangiaceae bacterium]|nr:glycosyltransferase family 39 protein [Polyangiaceae bacterium]
MAADTPAAERIARVVVVVATVWFAFTAVWGMFGIPGGGHLGAGGAGNLMAAEQLLRWKILYPAYGWYATSAPSKVDYICHHPFGEAYVSAFFLWIFGHHDFIVHLPAVVMSIAIPPLLYGIARDAQGPIMGAIAASSYAVVPIAVGFSNFVNLENVCIFGSLLFFWGHSRHLATRRSRYMLASLAGVVLACSGDWAGYLLIAPTLAWGLVRAFVLPPWSTPPLRLEAYARWWAFSVALAVGTLCLWVALFAHAGRIADWLEAADIRRSGNELPVRDVLESRKYWIDFSFTPVAIFLGKLAAPIGLARVVALRKDEETYAPSVLFGALVQYLGFKEGADVHIFWPHYFAEYFALAMPQLVGTLAWLAGMVARPLGPSRARAVMGIAGLVLGLAPVVLMAPDAARSLWIWRRTGGRYDDNGMAIRSDIDLITVLQEVVVPRTRRGSSIDVHPAVDWYWHHSWKWEGPNATTSSPAVGSSAVSTHPFWIGRASGLTASEQRKVAASAPVQAYGDTWVVDQRFAAAPLQAYAVQEREPGPLQWLLSNATEPVRTVGTAPDSWLTWELRTHLGQPADPPSAQPVTLDQMRIAYNVAMERGDQAAASAWFSRIMPQLNRDVETTFTGGVRLVGVRLIGGVEPRVEAWFECTAPMSDAGFDVRAHVEERNKLSLVGADATDRDVGAGMLLPTKLWRPTFLYSTTRVLNHRIGRERFSGMWGSRDGVAAPRRVDGKLDTTLVEVP